MNWKTFISVFLAVILALGSFNWYRDYSQTHIQIGVRWVLSAGTGEEIHDAFQIYKRWSPIAQAQGIHIYLIAERFDAGKEQWEPVVPIVNDQEIDEGVDFVGFVGTESEPIAYTVVCTTEVLSTFQEVHDASFNQYMHNSTSFIASPDWLPPVDSLKCK